MKKLKSFERSTGMGATRYTAILKEGKWVKVSRCPGAQYHGRVRGVKEFSIEVADNAISAQFYRSNSGKEHIRASNGMEWNSFEDAHRWASK